VKILADYSTKYKILNLKEQICLFGAIFARFGEIYRCNFGFFAGLARGFWRNFGEIYKFANFRIF